MTTVNDIRENSLILENREHLYPPSWIDRLTAWVGRLKLPVVIFYLNLWVILLFIETTIQWNNQVYSVGTLYPFHIFYTALIPFSVAMIHYLDKVAGEALDQFRSALNLSDGEYVELRYRLTNLPPRPAVVASLAGLLLGATNLALVSLQVRLHIFKFADTFLSVGFNTLLALISFMLFGLLSYHTLHQLRMVNHIYNKYAHINLFNLNPLFSLSGITARTAIGIIFLAYGWFATTPELINQTVPIALAVFFVVVAIFSFIWPLLGIHALLLAEKERLLVECNQRLEHLSRILHQQVDDKNLAHMDDMHKTLDSLEIEHKALYRIPTWPWQPETIRGVLAALLFPVILWITQWTLQRVLGP